MRSLEIKNTTALTKDWLQSMETCKYNWHSHKYSDSKIKQKYAKSKINRVWNIFVSRSNWWK